VDCRNKHASTTVRFATLKGTRTISNHRNYFYILGVLLFATVFSLGLIAARNAASATPQAAESDAVFAAKAASGGMAEVKLGQLAAEKGTSPAVKQFGQKMVDDHSKANDQLKSIAPQANVTLPVTAPAPIKPLTNDSPNCRARNWTAPMPRRWCAIMKKM
jgi:Domain of unknown function (DUF4142)